MRLINYINEKNDEHVFDLIRKNCKPYFKRFKKEKLILYSGRKRLNTWFEGKIRKNRKPLDMPEELHELTNNHFEKKFGVSLRSECLFAYELLGYTSHYGNPYIILPIGNFDIYWHPQIIDFFGELDDKLSNEFDGLQLMSLNMRDIDYTILEFLDKEIKIIVDKYVKNKPPVKKGIEIMIHGDKYYALSTRWINPNNYMDKIWEMFNEA